MTGHASEAEFIEAAGKSRLFLCRNHYIVGLNRLSDGDRAGAREHFQKALDTGVNSAMWSAAKAIPSSSFMAG